MFHGNILCVPRCEAIRRSARYLSGLGLHITYKAAPDISHVLLSIPSFPTGDGYLAHILADLPDHVIISGGNLDSPLLRGYRTVDFLKDPYYLAQNAAITAACAYGIVEKELGTFPQDCPVLIIGWGRIGKCLCKILDEHGARITVAVRKDADCAMIRALGYRGILIKDAAFETMRQRVIINTVPEMVLPDLVTAPGCVALELASRPGMGGDGIIDGRRLPGKMAPAASGELIARTFLRLSLGLEEAI